MAARLGALPEALRLDYPRQALERVREVSETNDRLYRTFASPWVRMAANPWMRGVAALAKVIARNRTPLP